VGDLTHEAEQLGEEADEGLAWFERVERRLHSGLDVHVMVVGSLLAEQAEGQHIHLLIVHLVVPVLLAVVTNVVNAVAGD